nr:hypothetical protein [uncultured Roseibium sp.]
MTRTGSAKSVDQQFGNGRLQIARSYLEAARKAIEFAEIDEIGNPVMSQIVHAAIGYTDALTAKYAGKINRGDHSAALKTLRDALGNRLPKSQANKLRNILDHKDEVQYGVRLKPLAEAESLFNKLVDFAAWAEEELRQ